MSPLARKVATTASALAPAASGPPLSSSPASTAAHVKAEHDADDCLPTSYRGDGGYGDDRYQTTQGAPHP
ncbi:hypothetical protein [Streptomyces sp. NPDC005828]|uniref:hypothetical protein n=1 Tax=Streptomyces sp. NPDC005828 TaxID=3157071 RepID=UPI00340C8F6F